MVLTPLHSHGEQKLCFEYSCWWLPPLWPAAAFTQPGTGWQNVALQAGKDVRSLCQASPSTAPPHQRSLDCLFTICCGNPQLFIAINNWAVCSGHSTKVCSVHSEARGRGSRSSMSRGGDTRIPAWRRSWCSQFLCSCRSLSGLHLLFFLSANYNPLVTAVGGATSLCLLGHYTNSRSLALIELLFLFRGSCLVSPVYPVHPRYLVVQQQPLQQIAQEWSIARVFVGVQEAQERNKSSQAQEKKSKARRKS